jgi:hypothetical protein
MKKVTPSALLLGVLLAPALLLGQETGALESGYQLPPKVIVDILDAPPPPMAVISPAQDVMALLDRASMPKIAELAEPMLRLAGVRVNPRTNGPHSPAAILGITFKRIADGAETKVALPPNARVSAPGFSPDGRWLSFMLNRANGVELWIADTASAKARALPSSPAYAGQRLKSRLRSMTIDINTPAPCKSIPPM